MPWRSSNDDEECSLLDSSSDPFELYEIKALMHIRVEFFSGKPQSDIPDTAKHCHKSHYSVHNKYFL